MYNENNVSPPDRRAEAYETAARLDRALALFLRSGSAVDGRAAEESRLRFAIAISAIEIDRLGRVT